MKAAKEQVLFKESRSLWFPEIKQAIIMLMFVPPVMGIFMAYVSREPGEFLHGSAFWFALILGLVVIVPIIIYLTRSNSTTITWITPQFIQITYSPNPDGVYLKIPLSEIQHVEVREYKAGYEIPEVKHCPPQYIFQQNNWVGWLRILLLLHGRASSWRDSKDRALDILKWSTKRNENNAFPLQYIELKLRNGFHLLIGSLQTTQLKSVIESKIRHTS